MRLYKHFAGMTCDAQEDLICEHLPTNATCRGHVLCIVCIIFQELIDLVSLAREKANLYLNKQKKRCQFIYFFVALRESMIKFSARKRDHSFQVLFFS